jgi:hypothetical protein
MLGINKRKEAARREILGVPANVAKSDYPDTITLPRLVLDHSFDARKATEEDMRERAIGFRFLAGRWRAGKVMLGGSIGYNEKTDALMAQVPVTKSAAMINRPHLFMHTHPAAMSEKVQAAMEDLYKQHPHLVISAEEPASEATEYYGLPSACYMLPSRGDVQSTMAGMGSSVAALVSSAGGNFMMVAQNSLARHHPVAFGETAITERRRQMTRFDKVFSEVSRTYYESDDLHDLSEETVPLFKRAIVEATSGVLACYYSSDPESPQLTRL